MLTVGSQTLRARLIGTMLSARQFYGRTFSCDRRRVMNNEVSVPATIVNINEMLPYTFLAVLGKRVIHPGGRPTTEEMYRLADFQPGQRVLEVGCGVGSTAIEIARRFNCHVTAIDIDDIMLNYARANVRAAGLDEKVIVQKADVLALPFSDQAFDRIMIETVLGFVDQAVASREVLRVCRRGGRVVDHEFMWERTPPDELLQISGVPTVLSPAGFLRDEGLKHTLEIAGHTISHPAYLLRLLRLMRRMRQLRPYLRWTIVAGVKAA
ncbi:MAG: class I SAM-dependent methyltransferase [Chloroflexi bacterium]|nr:MAG: class I SAM-dependent methyltransferase [Chloroflexota bacterium]